MELQRDNPEAQHNLGLSYLEAKNYEQAKEHFSVAIDIKPKNPIYYNNKALALYYANEFKEALEFFENAINIGVNN